jgi:DNA-binding beta-propeller fold protein YncE
MLVNDSTYAYRLRFVLTSGERGTSSDVLARPGPAQIWVADAASGAITRVSPDGRARVFLLPGLETPSFVGVEPVQGRVWSTSRDQGIVAVWSSIGTLIDVNGSLNAPGKVAPIPSTNDAWIDDERSGEVIRFNSGAGVTATATGFALPSDVVAIPGGAWAADRVGQRLVHLMSDATIDFDEPLPDRPWRLAYDAGSGDVWVSYTEAGAVECRNNAGTLRFRVNDLARPFTIAFDAVRGLAWIAEANGNEVVAFDRTGVRRAVIPVSQPRGVAVDTRTGEVWVTSLGSAATGTLEHFDQYGGHLTTLANFGRPSAVDIDPNP